MILNIQNTLDIPFDIRLDIVGYRKDEGSEVITDSLRMHVEERIDPVSVSEYTTIVLDENYGNPSIIDLLAILPNEIEVSGKAFIEGEGSAVVGQGVRALFDIRSPLSFSIEEPITYNVEVDTIKEDDLSEDEREDLRNTLNAVNAKMTFRNGLPVGGHSKIYIAVNRNDLFNDQIQDSSRKIILNAELAPGITDGDGYVQTPTESEVQLNLSDRQLDIFQFTPIFIRQELKINATNGIARFRQTDRIEVDAMIQVKGRINEEDD
ncbi:MAG: hypothetical protein GF313_11060 [Caldithrix sp.]|nr:hypothetical protein [Caldithrix sp.]